MRSLAKNLVQNVKNSVARRFPPKFPMRISKFLNSLNFVLLTVSFCLRPTIIHSLAGFKKNYELNMPWVVGCPVFPKKSILY